MKNLVLEGGEIFAIPLFIKCETDMKRFSKAYHKNENGFYAFCRIIGEEIGNTYLIEVFSKFGRLDTLFEEIINSPRLFEPIIVTSLGILKKRWIEIYKQKNYDKYKDSRYCDVKLVMGGVKICNCGKIETPRLFPKKKLINMKNLFFGVLHI